MPAVTVVISQLQYDFLARKALREETSIESYLTQFIERLALEGRDEETRMARDPVFKLTPAYGSPDRDLSTQHDHYLYGVPKK